MDWWQRKRVSDGTGVVAAEDLEAGASLRRFAYAGCPSGSEEFVRLVLSVLFRREREMEWFRGFGGDAAVEAAVI